MSEKHHHSSSSSSAVFGREICMHKLLGGGRFADVMLWREKKTSATTLVLATLIWVVFECMEYHLLTLLSHLLILSILAIFLFTLIKSPRRIPEIQFSEQDFTEVASGVRVEANRFCAILHDVACGRDLKKLFTAVASLWMLSLLGTCCHFLTLLYIVIVGMQTVPVVYEKQQDKVEWWANIVTMEMRKQYKAFDTKVLCKIPRGTATATKHNKLFN